MTRLGGLIGAAFGGLFSPSTIGRRSINPLPRRTIAAVCAVTTLFAGMMLAPGAVAADRLAGAPAKPSLLYELANATSVTVIVTFILVGAPFILLAAAKALNPWARTARMIALVTLTAWPGMLATAIAAWCASASELMRGTPVPGWVPSDAWKLLAFAVLPGLTATWAIFLLLAASRTGRLDDTGRCIHCGYKLVRKPYAGRMTRAICVECGTPSSRSDVGF